MGEMSDTLNRKERIKKTAAVHLRMESNKSLREIMDDFPENLKAMEYFYDKLKWYSDSSGFNPNGKKVIATMCIHVPLELIYAAGAIPVRICSGAYATDTIGAEFLPAKTCPLIKSTLGSLYANTFARNVKPDLIINPTTCDQKKKLPEVVEDIDAEFYTVEVPPTKDSEEARFYWQGAVKKLVLKLEKVTGQRITRSRLRDSIKMVAEAQNQFRRFNENRKTLPVIGGKDAILISNTFFFDDIMSWTAALSRLNDEMEARKIERRAVAAERAPRILLTGSPSIFPNMKLPVLIEKLGGIVVTEEFCSTTRLLYDTVAVDEWYLYDMIPAIADRYLKPGTCPNFTPNSDRFRKLLDNVRQFAVDGVIYQAFAGCQLYELESRKTGRLLSDEGIPMLYIETDYSPEDAGQLSTRIEAFLESIKLKKRKNHSETENVLLRGN